MDMHETGPQLEDTINDLTHVIRMPQTATDSPDTAHRTVEKLPDWPPVSPHSQRNTYGAHGRPHDGRLADSHYGLAASAMNAPDPSRWRHVLWK